MPGELHVRGTHTEMWEGARTQFSYRLAAAQDGAQFSYILQLPAHHKKHDYAGQILLRSHSY